MTVGFILTHMACPEDLSFVREHFQSVVSRNTKLEDASIEAMNNYLTLLTTQAVVAEATKLRDLMIRGRDAFKPFARKE